MHKQHEVITKDSIQLMVDTFYSSVRQDSILGPVFERALPSNWTAHIALITEFWSTVLLGSHSFRGNILVKHMALDGIQEEHFVRWLSLFKKTVSNFYREDAARKFLVVADRIAGRLQLGFFDKRSVTFDNLPRDFVD